MATDDQRQNLALGALGGVAEEFGGADAFLDLEPHAFGGGLAGAGPGGAGAGALLRHRRVEAREIDGAALFAQRVLRQVDREAERVVQAEGDGAGQRLAGAEAGGLLGQQMQAAIEGLAEAGFLQ